MITHGLGFAVILALFLVTVAGCKATSAGGEAGRGAGVTWAIAIHGGAGTLDRGAPDARLNPYREALGAALRKGSAMLAEGKPALDVAEAIVLDLEDHPIFNAGKGAVFTDAGTHELDASIMDGRTLACGGVAGVRTVKNPIRLARLVMEKSGHVLMMGDGAEAFAESMGVERVPNSYFDTPQRRQQLERKQQDMKRTSEGPRNDRHWTYGTVGCVVRDLHGNLAAATSTGGMTGKRFGRVGDSPLIGAGTFADNRSAAVSCTGTGEEFIRHTVARDVAALVEHKGMALAAAADFVVHQRLAPDDGGLIAVSNRGEIAMPFNTSGMYRAAADSAGRFEVAIFKDR